MGKMRTTVLTRNQTIREQYDKEIKAGGDVEETIEKIAVENGVGKFYVRSILKEQGLDIKRKSNYNRKDAAEQINRNNDITEMLQNGKSVSAIAAKYDLTETRVRQITKGLIARNSDYTKERDEIEAMVVGGATYDEIVSRHGRDTIKSVKSKTGYNAYREVLKQQNDAIVQMFKSKIAPLDIADHFGLTRDSIYLILKRNGLTSRISKDDKKKRDRDILKLSKKKIPIDEIASKYKLTSTMVRIIINNQ